MTSYVYNPSKKVTELLSQYLDFDPEQLQLGHLWTGHVTLRHVQVRHAAVTPYIAGSGLRLESGTIGALSLSIPWKSLVWGQGDVQVDVRNVVLTVALEDAATEPTATDAASTTDTTTTTPLPRETKQKLVREAEKRLHQKQWAGPWLQAKTRKYTLEEEKAAAQTATAAVPERALVKWFKSLSSDLVWRFCVGLQLHVENVKVLLVHEGVEIGVLVPSCTVVPHKNGEAVSAAPDEDSMGSSGTHPNNTSDGEQVDKQFKLVGIGVYVRPVRGDMAPPADVYTSDYVIRPVDVALDGSLFVPLPPEKRKKKKSAGIDDNTTVAGTDTGVSSSTEQQQQSQSSAVAQSAESTTETKRRRGKREKDDSATEELTVPTTRTSSFSDHLLHASTPVSPKRTVVRHPSMNHRYSSHGGVGRTHSAPALPLAQPDDIGATYTSRTRSFGQDKQTAKLDGKLQVGAVQVVCSTSQYHLLHVFLASSARVRKGRPATTIRSALMEQQQQYESVTNHSAFLLDHGDDSSATPGHNQNSFASFPTLQQPPPKLHRPTKSRVIRSWWHYLFHAVDVELQQRKRLRHVFSQKYLSFNWTAQQYKRREYVALYIALHLDKKNNPKPKQQIKEDQETLLALEDTLPVEQILLYRSLARSVHVRGGRKMPSSILSLQQTSAVEEPRMTRPSGATSSGADDTPVGFLASLTSRCQVARARLHQDISVDMAQFPTEEEEGDEDDPAFLYDDYEDDDDDDEDEGTYELDISESKTVRTHRSAHTTGLSVATTALDAANLHEMLENGMLFAFAMTVQRLELMIVGEETKHHGYCAGVGPGGLTDMAAHKNDQFACDTLSVLTDDHKFEQIEESSTAVVDESESGRIFPSSDFLLFQMPEKVILRLVVSSLACAAMGQSGGSRNLNFTVAHVDVSGENNVNLLSMGIESSQTEIPLDEIKVSNDFDAFVGASASPHNALSLSVVGRALSHFIQCDAPRIHTFLHVQTIEKVIRFLKTTGVTYPVPLLPRSPREELRLYILQQNQMLFTGVNCSVRIHGCNITVPLTRKEDGNAEMDISTKSATTTTAAAANDCLILRCDMIEMYSGDAVQDISASMQLEPPFHSLLASTTTINTETEATRRLSMLDVPGILLSNNSSLSSNWVFTMSGIGMHFSISESVRDTMFQIPVEVELLYSLNGDSLLDSNRARHEIVVEVSQLHLSLAPSDFQMLSELSRTLQDAQTLISPQSAEEELPRLEVLSKFMRFSIDLSVKHFRLVLGYGGDSEKLRASTCDQMEESLSRFLQVVSRYDLSFPHEDALALAMQMCIDRLIGLGLDSEVAWELSNLAMLKFLEEIADSQESEFGEELESEDELGFDGPANVDSIIEQIAQQTALICYDHVGNVAHDVDEGPAIVIEFPEGMSFTTVSLFYDSNLSFGIPALAVASNSGTQLLRITTSESSGVVENDETSQTDVGSKSSAAAFGVYCQMFTVDEKSELGKGGLPLIALGTDVDDSTKDMCVFERLCDIQFADIEVHVSNTACDDLIRLADKLSESFADQVNLKTVNADGESTQKTQTVVATALSITVIVTCENFLPFARMALSEFRVQQNWKPGGLEIASNQIELMNLSPQGDLHPVALATLSETEGCSLIAKSIGSQGYSITLKGVQLVFLRQFLCEVMQYFTSEDYELGSIFGRQSSQSPSEKESMLLVEMLESSIVLPRSSSSFEMMCIETERIVFKTSTHRGSFSKPTCSSPIMFDRAEDGGEDVSRISVCIGGARMYAAVCQEEHPQSHSTFRYFYELDGRADTGRHAFRRRQGIDTSLSETVQAGVLETAETRWVPCSRGLFSLDLLVDQGSHLRVLIADPIHTPKTGLHLSLTTQTFCSLLSVWYSNMQELPVMLPYSAEQLRSWSDSPKYHRKYPEYGTYDFEKSITVPGKFTCEVLVCLDSATVDCTNNSTSTDSPEYSFFLSVSKTTVEVSVDEFGVIRVGSGSARVELLDKLSVTEQLLLVEERIQNNSSWADCYFGLAYSDGVPSLGGLPQPFQLSVCMTPSWTIYNLGLRSPSIALPNLKPIFDFLSFVSAYFTDKSYGNPLFESLDQAAEWREEVRNSSLSKAECLLESESAVAGIDFRLWTTSPQVIVPSYPQESNSPYLALSGNGTMLYKFVGLAGWQSQELSIDGLSLVFVHDQQTMQKKQHNLKSSSTIATDVSMGLRFDHNESLHHTDISVEMPCSSGGNTLFDSRVQVKPFAAPRPTICSPVASFPNRRLDATVCDITLMVDIFPIVSTTLLNFVGDPDSDSEVKTSLKTDRAPTFSCAMELSSFRIFLLDPSLGQHLPLCVFTASSFSFAASTFSAFDQKETCKADTGPTHQDRPTDFQLSVSSTCWIDYFKLGFTRSWEPWLEPFSVTALFERSESRGSGIQVKSGCKMHLNISSAMFTIFPSIMRILAKFTEEKAGTVDLSQTLAEPIPTGISIAESLGEISVVHEIPSSDAEPSHEPLSMCNRTGGKIRLSQPPRKSELKASIVYLGQQDTTKLDFLPTVTRLENLKPVEVAYPGKDNLTHDNPLSPHELDIQLEGFKWIRMGTVDAVGRKFAPLESKVSNIQQKVDEDWQLKNVMQVLIETGLRNGGRLVTARSVFTVTNHTSCPLDVKLSPDKALDDDEEDRALASTQTILPGEQLNVPALLFVSAFQSDATCLGFCSVRPSSDSFDSREFRKAHPGSSKHSDETLSVAYSLKPLSLKSLVEESAEILCSGDTLDRQTTLTTGLQCPCPVWTESGFRLASFFFQIEVGRQPVHEESARICRQVESTQHGPLLYNVAVHAPIVISNLLSKEARFVLKHAVRDIMVWSADLKPGEDASVHTVGLDTPLLLFISVGFAKTPPGEGALVHHGAVSSDSTRGSLVGLKSIGKAGKAVTKQLGRTLTSMGESPGQGEGAAKHREASSERQHTSHDDDIEGKMYSVEKIHFLPEEIDEDIVLVDNLGQPLTLNIENMMGKGGQRKIAVFCRFWLVNTTEHCLRYRQENCKGFVAGAMHSPYKNGSTKTGPSPREPTSASWCEREVKDAIFSGAPGALASSPGRCDLRPEVVSALIDKNMSFDTFARTAFMFNFFGGHVIGIGQQKLCVQLGDSTGKTSYVSDWSRGLSLDSVGITQTVGIHCKDGRLLEINMVVHVAPGALANKTKIVRFLPRFVAVNNLSVPIRIWQDNSLFHPDSAGESARAAATANWSSFRERSRPSVDKVAQYENLWGRQCVFDSNEDWIDPREETAARGSALFIAALAPGDVVPFCLPDSRRDRQIRVDLGRPWDLSASVSADTPGDHTLRVSHAIDLQSLPHVSTRTSPQFEVVLSLANQNQFDGNLGIWFETEIDAGQHIVVKAIRKGSFCFNHTDVHLGDELLAIDHVPVSRMSFVDAMSLLKRRLNEVSFILKNQSMTAISSGANNGSTLSFAETTGDDLVISFRSVEERLRLVRLKAARASGSARQRRTVGAPDFSVSGNSESRNRSTLAEEIYMRIDLKTFERSDVGMFVVVDKKPPIPFRLRNQSTISTICYRQRGCGHHPWRFLRPGCSTRYTWEEPLRPKRLQVRIALDSNGPKSRTRTKPKDEEEVVFSSPISVRLEDIGFEEVLPLPEQQGSLKFSVDIEESSRVLVVSDESSDDGHLSLLREQLQCVASTISEDRRRVESLRSLPEDNANMASEIAAFPLVHSNSISDCHQLSISVEEARGLNCGSLVGACNPYVVVKLKGCSENRRQLFRSKDVRKSVYVKNTSNPAWKDQNFVFNLSPDAVRMTRGCAVQIEIKSFRVVGRHIALGRTGIDLHCLRDQIPREGWFSLSGRNGRQELENDHSHWGRGSIKLRLHWIHSPSALLQYFILLSEKRLADHYVAKSGIERQIKEIEMLERQGSENTDDAKPLRFKELFSLSKNNMKARAAEMQKRRKPGQSVVKKLIDPLRNFEIIDSHRSSKTKASSRGLERHNESIPLLPRNSRNNLRSKRSPDGGPRKRLNSSPGLVRGIEDQISETRQSIQRFQQSRPRFGSSQTIELDYIRLPPQAFKSWSLIQAIRSYGDLELVVVDDDIKVELRNQCRAFAVTSGEELKNEGCVVSSCFSLPSGSPEYFSKSAAEVARNFVEARTSANRSVAMALKTMLNPGGWLTLRPISALNLPEGFTKLLVEVKYGSEVLTSTSAIVTATPEWSTSENGGESRNDIHLHVAPQKTSGCIRVAVVGEKKKKKLYSKVELGVVYLPLGPTIAACVNESEDEARTGSAEYTRWFPLKPIHDVMHSEGDAGLSTKPLETEKKDCSLMANMFAPCLKLALLWLPENKERTTSGVLRNTQPASKTKVPKVKNYFAADICSISVSLIDSAKAKELLSFNLLDLDLHFWSTKAKTRFGLTAGWLQIDYQNDETREPVVFAPTQSDQLVPVVQTLAVKDNQRSMLGVAAFDFIDISLAEFDITVEENLVFDLFSFLASILREASKVDGLPGFSKAPTSGDTTFYSDLTTITKPDQVKLYIRQLFLGVLRVNLSYVKGRRSQSWKEEPINADAPDSEFFMAWAHADEESDNIEDDKQSRAIPSYLTNLLPNVSDAPIRLPGKALSHVFQHPSEILKWVRRFYITEVLKQLYRILGSLDFVGNPTMLLTSFLSGVHDMVVAPSVALLNSPTDPSKVGLIFAQGTLSMVSHSTSGFFGTLAKVTASAGQGVAAMSLDADFREWHRNEILTDATNINRVWKKRGVQNVGRMVTRPLTDVMIGVTGGVIGVITSPIKGYRRSGNRGLAEGICVGLVGLVAKPLVGFLDSFSHFAGSIHDVAKSVNVLDKRVQPAKRLRLPYAFAVMGILAPYDGDRARAQKLLHRFPLVSNDLAESATNEAIVHVEVLASTQTETFIIATSHRVAVVRVTWEASGASGSSRCWQGTFSSTQTVSSIVDEYDQGHGSSLTLSRRTTTTDQIEIDTSNPRFELSSLRMVNFVTPKQKLGREGDEPQKNKSTERSGHASEDQFTVLGEYRFRHQLIKIHNAICCITQRFEKILLDPLTSDHLRRKEGHLSFGGFHFRETVEEETTDEFVQPTTMENIPWISHATILDCHEKPTSEQKLYLHAMRDGWNLDKELELASSEGGPAWLVHIRAKSRFVGTDPWHPRTLQPAEPLAVFEEENSEIRTPEVRESTTSASPPPLESQSQFHTAHGSQLGADEPAPLLTNVSNMMGKKAQRGFLDSPLDASTTRRSPGTTSAFFSSSFTTARNDAPILPHLRSDFNASIDLQCDAPPTRSESRLERMEAILEQLVMFTAQQYRAQTTIDEIPSQAELAALRQQVDMLRTDLNSNGQAQDEIVALRDEINNLKGELSKLRSDQQLDDETEEGSSS